MHPELIQFYTVTIAAAYVAYLEYRRTKMALDMTKLAAAIGALRNDRDTLKSQVAIAETATAAAVAKAEADNQAQVDAQTAAVDPAPVVVPVEPPAAP